MMRSDLKRRDFLGLAATSLVAPAWADDWPPVTNLRATDGDAAREPDWGERLTLTVGPDLGDLSGRDDKVIQAALD